jgi:hypothetical protein
MDAPDLLDSDGLREGLARPGSGRSAGSSVPTPSTN